ncbi:MAG: translation initiation factor IF-3 [Spirochaetes bacterium]|nr:MAG: translation initiation factor IF-3 [Spirochaetota bacterium]
MNKKKKEHKLNSEITYKEVRVTDEGIMSIGEAMKLAESQDMDLVLINEKAQPPVCRIMNYEKFIYEQGKKPKNKTLDIKEIKLGPNTSENDLQYRIKHMIEFLQKGHKVKISLQFRGRQMQHIDIGQEQILKMILAVEEYGVPEAMPKLEGKKMFATIKPKATK